jgi:WD40 repeat protein/predicted Ser/Thr protein kinase
VIEADMFAKQPDDADALSSSGNRDDFPEGFPGRASSLTLNLKQPTSQAVPPGSRSDFRPASDRISTREGAQLGDYELLSVVGRGGMGIVFKARHRILNRIVALKVTSDAPWASASAAHRFQVEAAAIARLDHPNIVPIYDIGESAGQQFYSMAFIQGRSLAQVVAASPLPPRRAVELMQSVAAAIAYAHAQGVVHRDLKPENILLDAGDRPRITDFGMARCSDTDSRLTQAGEVLGTPSYMPPEQAQGHMERIGPLSDVYSLGATLYCLLTGRPPFQAASALDTMKHVLEREPVSPRQINPAVDRDLETICLKCLEKTPERRYPSATALAEDLERFLEHRAILARPVSSFEKAGRWCRRNPFAAGSLACLVGVFLAAFALVSGSYWRAEEAFRKEAQQRAAANEARDAAQRHEQAERWERYRANMLAVASAFQSQNISVARRAIDAAPPEHRNWEWRHFHHLLDQSQQVLFSGDGTVEKVRFAGNNRLVAVGRHLRVWDRLTGRVVRALDDFSYGEGPIIEVDPQGRFLAYPTLENTIVLQDLIANRRHAILRGCEGMVAGFQFSPDGSTLSACTRKKQVNVWDTASGNCLRTWSFQEGKQERLGFNINSQRLLVMNFANSDAGLWDTRTGRKQATLKGHQTQVVAAAFNPEGTRVVTSEAYPSNVLRLWDTRTGKQIALLRGHGNESLAVLFSPDGKRIASCSFDQTVRLWDGMTGEPIATLNGHSGRVMAIGFSPDSRRLVSASQDHNLRLWGTANGEPIAILGGHAGDVRTVAYSPDGTLIASGSTDQTTRVWDARLAERNGILRGHTSYVYDVAFHPDGERLVSASWDGTVRLWHATSGRQVALIRYPETTILTSVAIDPAGKRLATLGRDNSVRLWDIGTGRQLHRWRLPTAHWRESRAVFSPQGDVIAAGSVEGAVHLLDVPRRRTRAVLRGHRDTIYDVAFGPEGRWLASAGADADKTIRIWDVATWKQLRVLTGHTDGVLALAISRDGKLLASGSRDGTVRLWSTATWKEVAILKHGTSVYGLAFTPDGTRLATGCADNSIRFWNVPTAQEVAELRGHGSYVKALAFSPDGTRLASASGDFTVRISDTLPARERGRSEK